MATVRVEYAHGNSWVFWTFARNDDEGIERARDLWRRGVAGVRVVRLEEVTVLERMRE